MPADGPAVIMAISKLAGVITGPVDLPTTYTNSFATTRTSSSATPPRAESRCLDPAVTSRLPRRTAPARHPAQGQSSQDVTFEA